MIVETHTGSPLCPMVGDEHGRVRDLSDPSSPTIWEVEEDGSDHLQEIPAKERSSLEVEHNITLAS